MNYRNRKSLINGGIIRNHEISLLEVLRSLCNLFLFGMGRDGE